MWSAAGRWWSEQRQRSTCCGASAWGNWAVAPFQASSLTPGGRLTVERRLRVARRFLTRRRSFPFSRNTRVGFPKARRARRSNSGFLSPLSKTSMDSSFTTRLWEGEDVDVAVSMVQEAQALYPELRACSFDRGFHSRDNRVRLDALLDVNALPGRGYLSRADREREEEESFVAARRAHPAIESATMGWSIGDSTEFAAMVRTASRVRLPCRAGGQPASHRVDPAEAGTQTTTTHQPAR